jgi:hypothetical protein
MPWYKKYVRPLALTGGGVGGCVAAAVTAGAGVGYMIHDEATEKDGKFDPLENVRKKGDGRN